MKKRPRSNSQLHPEDMLTTASPLQQGGDIREIARTLARPASTISREIERNTCARRGYASCSAQAMTRRRRAQAHPGLRLTAPSRLKLQVLTMLSWKWPPQQISTTRKRMHPDAPRARLSHEAIDNTLYVHPRGELRRELLACLRWARSKRRSRLACQDRSRLSDALSIHLREPDIDDRILSWHWEGDFSKGALNQSSVGVLVERVSRLVILVKMADATAASALAGFAAKLNAIPEPMR